MTRPKLDPVTLRWVAHEMDRNLYEPGPCFTVLHSEKVHSMIKRLRSLATREERKRND